MCLFLCAEYRYYDFIWTIGIPVPIVAISVGVAHDQYGNDDL